MNFAKYNNLIPKLTTRIMKSGDLVITYERHDSLDQLYLENGKIFNNKFGSFHHDDFIGKPYGSKITSRLSSGWMYALEPTPELWSSAIHVIPLFYHYIYNFKFASKLPLIYL